MNDKASLANPGVVVSVRGSVVDITFDAHLPPIYSMLRAGENSQSAIEVSALRKTDSHVFGSIVLCAFQPDEKLGHGFARVLGQIACEPAA